MFRHPFINNTRLLIFYCLFWVVLGVSSSLINIYWYEKEAIKAISLAIIWYVVYPALGSSIWYVIKFDGAKETGWLKTVTYHLIAATILNVVWLYLGNIFVKIVYKPLIIYLNESIPSRLLFGYFLYSIYVVFFYAISYYQSLREKIKKEAELTALIREAELSALKSQINPHFLFNSLNSISSLTVSNPSKAQEMVVNLSAFMRYSLQLGQEETVSFEQELENIKLYLAIEKIRFGKKMNPVFDISDECLKAQIPNMILQPLYENAIKYGVYEAMDEVLISTSCQSMNDHILITIENDYEEDAIKNRGEGIGLRNIQQRLELIYGKVGLLKITDKDTRFKVELMIPQNN